MLFFFLLLFENSQRHFSCVPNRNTVQQQIPNAFQPRFECKHSHFHCRRRAHSTIFLDQLQFPLAISRAVRNVCRSSFLYKIFFFAFFHSLSSLSMQTLSFCMIVCAPDAVDSILALVHETRLSYIRRLFYPPPFFNKLFALCNWKKYASLTASAFVFSREKRAQIFPL